MIKRGILLGLLSLQVICSYAVQKSSITQYGITWTFDHSYECGQFVTGDWWVVGPVTIVSATPLQTAAGRNGSVLNPKGSLQGYDAYGQDYDANLRVVFPLTIGGINSLVSSESSSGPHNCTSTAGTTGYLSRTGRCDNRPILKSIAVLTIVNAIVPAGTFRPSLVGPNNKSFFSVNSVDYNVLPHLPMLSSTPSSATLRKYIDRPGLDHFNGWTAQMNYAYDNFPGYGTVISNDISEIAGYLMLDAPDLEELARLMIQKGIDNYGALLNGSIWPADGGHGSGRKWPILFAGKLLNNQAMLNIGNSHTGDVFGEDCQTFYLAGTPSPATAWWGIRHCSKPWDDQQGLGYRICCTSRTWPGQMLTALMLGLKTNWNHTAYFDYVDHWVAEDASIVDNYGSNTPQFIYDLWNLYRNNLPPLFAYNAGNPNPDVAAPTTAINLATSAVAGSSLTLSWTAASDNIRVIAYDIYQNGVFSKTVAGFKTNSIIDGLLCNTTYSFTIKARDAAGNSSAFSNVKVQTTTGVCDPFNVALNKPIIVSSYQNDAQGNFPGQKLVDGDESDNARWSAPAFPQWAEIDLGANYNLNLIKLYPFQNLAYKYIIEAKPAGGVYSTIVNRSNNTTPGDVLIDNVICTARYVKITVTSGGIGGWASLAELKVFGLLAGSSNSDNVAPTTPINLVASSVAETSLKLTWTAATDNIGVVGYDIYQNNIFIKTVVGSLTNSIIGLTCNTTYSFTVKARDAAGNSSAFSNIEVKTTSAVCDPNNIALNKPVIVSAYQNNSGGNFPGENLVDGDESDNMRWSAQVFPQWAEIDLGTDYNLSLVKLYPYQNNAYKYIIEAKPNGGTYSTIVDRSANTTAADALIDNVTGTARYVKITVTGLSSGTSQWTSLAELKVYGLLPANPNPDNTAPTAPINLSASAVAGNSLTLTWTGATDNIGVIAYDIYQDNLFIKTVAGSITTSIMSGLVCNTSYSFTVKARDAAGNSSVFSNVEIQATTGVCDPINIALNKLVTVSSYQNDTQGYFPGQNLVDGDESDNTRWSAEVFPQWAEIDLGADYNLSSVKLYPYQNRAYQYIIETKPTGGIYSTIVNRSTNTTGSVVLADNVTGTGRYVKITITGVFGVTSVWTSLAELKVYGTLSSVVTGISEKTTSGITMIPNPTTGILNLSVSTEWTLKSIEGKMLQTGTGKIVDLSKYANGVYIIVIGNKQEKIIKL